mgnify:CR=1 FL=1
MNTIPALTDKQQQDLTKRMAKRHQEWLKTHFTGQIYMQLYRCAACGYDGSHEAVVEHMKTMGCKV